MLVESNSISRPIAPDPSLDYNRLYLEGLQHIEALSGKIWTDYNAHDPGISILEVLCYAITELGYRCDFEIGDIIAPSPGESVVSDFFSLAEAASNAPLTINDFRKIIIDLDGYRNAWLEKVTDPRRQPTLFLDRRDTDKPIFINSNAGLEDEVNVKQIKIKGLYDVFLQFEEHPDFGDLNDNSLDQTFMIKPIGLENPWPFVIEVEFPIWEKLSDDFDIIQDRLEQPPSPDTTIFTIDMDGLAAPVTAESFAYAVTIVINESDRPIELDLVLRVISGQEYVVNKNEFLLRISDLFKDQVLMATDPTPTEGAKALLVKFLKRRKVIQGFLEDARKTLAENRNLCEDFDHLYPMNLEEIGIDVALDVVPGTNMETVMAEVYHRTQLYLSPTIRFYSLREMLDKGYTAEEIFRGPILQNGFIDEHEAAFNLQREKIYTSDLLQEFMKIPGVKVVKRLALSLYREGMRYASNATECLCLASPQGRYLTRLNLSRSNVSIDAGNGKPEPVDATKALELLSELKALNQLKGSAERGDFLKPTGNVTDLQEYFSIQNEFPANYAIGVEGVAESEPALRKAQAHQLKAFLMFFDQLLANFHAQLENIKQLYSYSDDAKRTYFTQALFEVPQVQDLLKDYTDIADPKSWDTYKSTDTGGGNYYPKRVDALAETPAIYQDRRKRFLDHLLARFNESFSEYAAYVFSRSKMTKPAQYETLIKHQSRFLREYVKHSRARGAAYDYQSALDDGFVPGSYFTSNASAVTGLKQRMVYLAGLPKIEREYINPFRNFEVKQDGGGEWRFSLDHSDGGRWFYSSHGYGTLNELLIDMAKLVTLCADDKNFEVSGTGALRLKEVIGATTTFLGTVDAAYYDDKLPIGKSTGPLADFIASQYDVENLHIVEHILLRQRNSSDPTLQPRIITCCPALDIEDPYSFRISVVLPIWSGRFKELEFRRLFKRLMRMEAPAHVYIHFYWIDPVQMFRFENCLNDWLNGEWLVDNTKLLWQDDPKGFKANLVQEDKFLLLIDRRAAGGEDGIYFVDCMVKLKNLFDCYYEVMPPRIIDQYDTHCELLARPIDPDGEITQAWLAEESLPLPPGTCLDCCNGEVRINDLEQFHLQASAFESYPLQVVTINSAGEVTHSSFTITFIVNFPSRVDQKLDAMHIGKYRNGMVLLSFTDPEMPFTDGRVEQWFVSVDPNGPPTVGQTTPPLGMVFDLGNGDDIAPTIKVVDANLLLPRNYKVSVWLADSKGGESYVEAEFAILPDNDATVDRFMPIDRNQDAYVVDQVLAIIRDEDEGIESFSVVGTPLETLGLSAAIDEDPPVVKIKIADIDVFHNALGIYYTVNADNVYRYSMLVHTRDNCGGTSSKVVEFTILKDLLPSWDPAQPMHVGRYAVGTSLGLITDPNQNGLESVDDNGVLSGKGLKTVKQGESFAIVVENAALFKSQFAMGTQVLTEVFLTVSIDTKDVTGGKASLDCTMSAYLDRPSIANHNTPMLASLYTASSPLATITDLDGNILSAVVAPGSFPPSIGMRLLFGTGRALPGTALIEVFGLPEFLQAVADPLVFVPVVSADNRVRYEGFVDTTDASGGANRCRVRVDVLRDPPIDVTVSYFINNTTQDLFLTEGTVASITKGPRSLTFLSAVPALPPGIVATFGTGGSIRLMVNNNANIVPGSYSFTVNMIDSLYTLDSKLLNVQIRPIVVKDLSFEITSTGDKSKHFFDVTTMEPNLTIMALEAAPPMLPIGTLQSLNGKLYLFTEGPAYATSGTISLPYRGIRDNDQMAFKGNLILTRFVPEALMTIIDRANARPLSSYFINTVLFDIQLLSTQVTNFTGTLPSGVGFQVVAPGTIRLVVTTPGALVPGHYFVNGNVIDNGGRPHPVRLTISILPDDKGSVFPYFGVSLGSVGAQASLDIKPNFPGVTINSFIGSLPTGYGTLNRNDGKLIIFTRGSSFNASIGFPIGVEFVGTDSKNLPITGFFTIQAK
jgi:hypothetical protein